MLINGLYLGSNKIIKSYLGSKLIIYNNSPEPEPPVDPLVVPDGWIDIREGMIDGTPSDTKDS